MNSLFPGLLSNSEEHIVNQNKKKLVSCAYSVSYYIKNNLNSENSGKLITVAEIFDFLKSLF